MLDNKLLIRIFDFRSQKMWLSNITNILNILTLCLAILKEIFIINILIVLNPQNSYIIISWHF